MKLSKKIISSFLELKNIYSLAAIAMLLALRVVLGFFANGTLAFFGNSVKISGSFLPIAVKNSATHWNADDKGAGSHADGRRHNFILDKSRRRSVFSGVYNKRFFNWNNIRTFFL